MRYWERSVLQKPPHEEVEIPWQHPSTLEALGYYRSGGEPRGQDADFRLALDDGRSIHIRYYGDRVTAHWDWKDPSRNLLGHLLQDAPHWALLFGLGALVFAGMADG